MNNEQGGAHGAAAELKFLDGGGAMGGLIAQSDWSTSPLGVPANWTPMLKSTVAMMLPAAAQIVLFWGPEFVALYNDSYAPTIGDKHPRALGRPARENWAELWDDLEPLLTSVLKHGETVSAADRPFYIERHGGGETVYFDISYSPVRDGDGVIRGVLCLVKETTERVVGEQRLRESEQALRLSQEGKDKLVAERNAILSQLTEGVIVTDRDGRIVFVNRCAEALHGGARLDIVPEDYSQTYHLFTEDGAPYPPEELPLARAVLHGDTVKDARWRIRRPDGSEILAIGSAHPLEINGENAGGVLTLRDDTERHEAEAALRESEIRFRQVFQNAGVGMIEIDADWKILSANAAYCRITGRDEAALTGASCLSFTHSDDVEIGAKALASLAAGATDQISFEKRYVRPDGGITWVRSNLSRISDAEGASRFLKVVEDITDIREVREALRESEERYRTLFDAIDEGFCIIRFLDGPHGPLSDYEHVQANPAYLANAGIADIVGKRLREIVSESEADAWSAIYRDVLLTGEPIRFERELMETGRHLDLAAFRVGSPDQRRVAVLFQDVTARKRAANALHEAEERYRLAARATNDAIWDWDLVTNHVLWNEALYAGYGYTAQTAEPTSRWWMEHIHPDDRDRVSHSIHKAIDEGAEAWTEQYRFRRADGGYAEILDRGAVIRGEDGKAIRMIGAMLDQTERLRAEAELRQLNETLEQRVAQEVSRRSEAEEALRQAQKMETLGQLTGGVAHDFNNLLQIVSGNIGLIQRGLPQDDARLRRAAENAARGAERAAVLTQRLLAFSRRQPLAPKPIDPNKMVGGMSDLLHRTLGEMIEVETVLAPRLWPIEADPNQLENAILNLAINARDAMPDGGKLTIETCNTHLDRAYVKQNAEVAVGQYVCICVTDSGSGMDEDTVARAFEPFFTTKEVGKGTGLGLSMVYGFVKQSGGHLKIYSERGEGTTVKIYLPRLIGERPEADDAGDELIPAGGQNETILVCEDDADVRTFTVEVLTELGYRVLEAGDGPTTLALLDRTEQVDLLFTDVVLPNGMTGAVLAREALARRPGLKVLFTTGYARNAIVHHGRLDPGVELITKPFSYADLAARVRDVLDGQP